MKRLVLIALLALVTFSANAQMRIGGNFGLKFDTEKTQYNSGEVTTQENAYMIYFYPKIYWNLSDKLRAGGRVGFAFGRTTTGTLFDQKDAKQEVQRDILDRAIGWSVSPFCGYKILNWKVVSVWIEGNLLAGQYYNVGQKIFTSLEWNKCTGYGFQILPVVDFDITEKLSIQVHLGIISLGWFGETYNYDNKVTTRSYWDIRKGGADGLLQGIADYGVGIVRKF